MLQIHDELLVECSAAQAARAQEILQEEMTGTVQFHVPLIAEAHSGENWLDAK